LRKVEWHTLEEKLVAIAGKELGALGRDGRNGGDQSEQKAEEDGEQHGWTMAGGRDQQKLRARQMSVVDDWTYF